ncbi:hypothetical protein [Streptomyces sp. CHB9.2]|uniref:DUF7941 domain-family protein n=1 Tax=Streptomyces sp. CHB9.2 TaxID=2841670 RepID=UPI002094E79F|nr:hypothetical protein [Streptomyces sp. CHB9.2]MCO6704724.1 hypothetical protein [Streptomyces sp. CHB9.2]
MTTIRSLPAYAIGRTVGRTEARNVLGYAIIDTGDKLTRPAGDTDYRKPEQELLMELVDRANPGVFDVIDRNQVIFETPVGISYTRGDEADTTIVAKAAPNALDVIGRQTLRYRRIDLSKLFRYQTVVLTRYSNSNTLPYAEVIELLLKQHGINIDPSTFTAAACSVDVARTFTAVAGSRCYSGSITVIWKKGKREIADLFTTPTLDGRVWPEGLIQFGDTYKPQGEYIVYDIDFTDSMASQFTSWSNGALTSNASGQIDVLVAALKTVAPQINWNSNDYSVDNVGGLQKLLFNRYAIPNAAVPEANSGLFNRVAVLTPTSGDAWFYGRLLFHYKV